MMTSDKKKTSPKDVAKRIAERKLKAKAKIDAAGKKSISSSKKSKTPAANWYQKAKESIAISTKRSDH